MDRRWYDPIIEGFLIFGLIVIIVVVLIYEFT